MAFNHYAKIKRILENEPDGWYVKQINQPTTTTNFKGDTVHYPHYYRIYSREGVVIKYCKFQQLERLAHILGVPAETLPIVE